LALIYVHSINEGPPWSGPPLECLTGDRQRVI
jgi:hypothetical protein